MTSSVFEIRKANAKKRNQANRESSLQQYEKKQAEIRKLLKQIEVGLEKHDHAASGQGGHHWGHVGDLASIAATLVDLKDRLHHTGQYVAEKRYKSYDRNGMEIEVSIP